MPYAPIGDIHFIFFINNIDQFEIPVKINIKIIDTYVLTFTL